MATIFLTSALSAPPLALSSCESGASHHHPHDDATKILNAPNPATFTATYSGFVLGEGPSALSGTLSCTTTAVTNSPVGGYPITCSGQTSTNYAITYVAGTLHMIYAPDGACVKDKEPSHQILQPINADGTSVFNGNGPIDVKFRVCDANGVSQSTPGVAHQHPADQRDSGHPE